MLIEALVVISIFTLVAGVAWGVANSSRSKGSDNSEQGNSPTPKSTESNLKPSLAKPKKTPLLNPSAKIGQTIHLTGKNELSIVKSRYYDCVDVYFNQELLISLHKKEVLPNGLIAALRKQADRLGSRSITLEQARKISKVASAIEVHATGENKVVSVAPAPVKRSYESLPNIELQRTLDKSKFNMAYGVCKACDRPIEYCRCAG
ncbi:hypothetical protein AB4238_05715 [Shewanella sp. 10N.286.45.A1]|uniref:hypothetical protein n=1 Tax=Shewanella sp. 10N.286.45.A1 TaxID=3229694 RepID=UPI00355101F1